MKIAPALLTALAAASASGADWSLGPKSLNYGVGIRIGGGYSDMSPTETLGLQTLDVRPYITGQFAPWLKFTGNLDLNHADNDRIHVLDAIGQFEPNDLFNVWIGRFLPPSDRANLSGPYYQNAWNFPATVNAYPSIFAGRADGGAVWGQIGKGQIKYQAGVFTLDSSTPPSQAIYAGRVVLNLLDPEPGYYNSSTYYGAQNVLAVGGAVQYKKTAASGIIPEQKFIGFNFDLLFEKKLVAANVLTLEGAYYNFNQGNAAGSQGWSAFGLASWLVADKLGPGRVQPMFRYQHAEAALGGATKTIDGGINYILEGHNLRMALVVQNTNPPSGSSFTGVQVGLQVQE